MPPSPLPDPACAAKKQGKLKVKWSINGGRGRKARGDGASSVAINLSKLPIDGGTVCVDFSGGRGAGTGQRRGALTALTRSGWMPVR
jgi:hypothetical protein